MSPRYVGKLFRTKIYMKSMPDLGTDNDRSICSTLSSLINDKVSAYHINRLLQGGECQDKTREKHWSLHFFVKKYRYQ